MPATDGATSASAGSPSKEQAIELFRGLPARYDQLSAALSFWQDPRWRRALVDAIAPAAGERILDVATGTGMVAAELLARERTARSSGSTRAPRCSPAPARVSPPDPDGARVELIAGQAEQLPFADAHVRRAHVHLPAALCRRSAGDDARARAGRSSRRAHRLARVRRPSARRSRVWRGASTPPSGLPVLGRLFSREWAEVGRFLGPSIAGFYARHPLPAIVGYWQRGRAAGRPRAAHEPRRGRRHVRQEIDADARCTATH